MPSDQQPTVQVTEHDEWHSSSRGLTRCKCGEAIYNEATDDWHYDPKGWPPLLAWLMHRIEVLEARHG